MITARSLLLFTLCSSVVFISKAQSFQTICTYRFVYQVDSTNPASKKSEDMLLLLNADSSVFISKGTFIRDSVLSAKATQPDVIKKMWAEAPTDFHFRVVKDKSSELSFEDFIPPASEYVYREPRSTFQWEIRNDTATISGLHCQKATTYYGGRTWTAWFAPEIARNDGPYKFCGLPGLIISIMDDQDYYAFTLASIENRSGYVLFPKDKQEPVLTSKKDFVRAMTYYSTNTFDAYMQSGKINDPGKIQQMKLNMENRYKIANIQIER